MCKKIKNRVNRAVLSAQNKIRSAVANVKAEGYVDSGVKILIAVVIDALLLGLLYTLTKTTIMGTVSTKVSELFNYTGPTNP